MFDLFLIVLICLVVVEFGLLFLIEVLLCCFE